MMWCWLERALNEGAWNDDTFDKWMWDEVTSDGVNWGTGMR